MNKFPVLNVKLVNINLIEANDYNPNNVANPEFKLLELSIKEDGYTQPIVTYYDKKNNKYIIVDGFHRYKIGKKLKYKELPIVTIDKNLDQRIASTIRHNRARGKHSIIPMINIVKELSLKIWDDNKIAKHLGMDADEVLRLKQESGIAEVFKNHVFNNSWE